MHFLTLFIFLLVLFGICKYTANVLRMGNVLFDLKVLKIRDDFQVASTLEMDLEK